METRFINFFPTIKKPPSTHILYLWVGEPTKTNPQAIAGHDVDGPIQMAIQLAAQYPQWSTSVRIEFYCLSEHANFYRQQFKEMGVDIAVNTIEELIEQEEKIGEFKAETAYVKHAFLKLASVMESTQFRVATKDLFSTYLLLTQAGYFLDTNVFPRKNISINLDGEKSAAAVCCPYSSKMHDFYFMYSPKRGDAAIRNVLKNWLKFPDLSINRLSVLEGTGLSFIDIENKGLDKISFKSYTLENTPQNCGLLYWYTRSFDEEFLKRKLPYGDINQQFSSLNSIKFLEECCLEYITISQEEIPDENDLLARLPENVNQAYFLVVDLFWQREEGQTRPQIFFVNKEKNMAVCVYTAEYYNARLPYCFKELRIATNNELADLFSFFGEEKVSLDSLPAPKYICFNIESSTLLHHAILNGELKKAKYIIEAGANLDLKAKFQLVSSKEIFEFTPLELAKYLKQDEFVKLLSLEVENKEVKPIFTTKK